MKKTSGPQPLSRILLLILPLLLAACAVPASRTLHPASTTTLPAPAATKATLLLHPFSEAFPADTAIGLHRLWGDRQSTLLLRKGEVGQALTGLLYHDLSARGIAVAPDGDQWDRTPEGLARFGEPVRLLLSGRITALRINGDETLTTGRARAEMDVECVLGLVRQQKVIRRSVHVAQEMVTFSLDGQTLETLLNNCLVAASKEILAQCGDLVASPAPSSQLTRTTAPDGAKRLFTQ